MFQPSCETVINHFKQSVIVADIRLTRQLYNILSLQQHAKLVRVLHHHLNMNLCNASVKTHYVLFFWKKGKRFIHLQHEEKIKPKRKNNEFSLEDFWYTSELNLKSKQKMTNPIER